MIIACPSCNMRYKVDPDRFDQDEITFRCKNCNQLLKIDRRIVHKSGGEDSDMPDLSREVAAVSASIQEQAERETAQENSTPAGSTVDEKQAREAADTGSEPIGQQDQAIKKPYKILVADDEMSICMLVEEILAGADYHVITAHDGLEAFQMVKLEQPDLVILDLLMPKMTGFEVLKEIRAVDKNLPVLVMTAIYKKASQVLVVKELGASGYLEKPFPPDHLLFRVANLLKSRE